MLEMVLQAPSSIAPHVTFHVTPQVERMLPVLHGEVSRRELQQTLNLSDRASFRTRYLKPAMEWGPVEPTIPDKPPSRLQKYRLTALGRTLQRAFS